MSFQQVLATVRSGSPDLGAYDELARTALAEGEEEAALTCLVPAAKRMQTGLLWQWAGLLQRSLDEHETALRCFARASTLAPENAGIAHGHAQVALEAGMDAVDLFLRARALAPASGDVALGLAAARNAVGQGALAAEELSALLERAPAWISGHEQLAQLLSTLGQKDRATASLEHALARFPSEPGLWSTLLSIDVRREDYVSLAGNVARARAAGVSDKRLMPYRAIAAAELDHTLFPAALFDTPPCLEDELRLWQIRHLLRVGAVDECLPLIEQELASTGASAAWPYAALAWRIVGDERSKWLEGDPRFVRVFDLTASLSSLPDLAEALRRLHVAKGEYLDQSVRGGTQTDGPLLSRIDPKIQQLRRAIVCAASAYIRQLPVADPRHPLLSQRRDRRIRFAGSWSVRLRAPGRHANHVHTEGWISSALYVSLPPQTPATPKNAGWLMLGQPQEQLAINLEPLREIEPKLGHLVLFPSWMWHGTRPFSLGERLTVAFDVRPPI